ncbi:hypothetical protein FDUTEX481_04732 [Tolypothrix sp. PCC 7601]|nr:hypothetical protein FDUTEX481_04732 [Tolypothrix sp. PCC 7601]
MIYRSFPGLTSPFSCGEATPTGREQARGNREQKKKVARILVLSRVELWAK